MRITQECGQKWCRRRSWKRPVFRKLTMHIIDEAEIDHFQLTPAGTHVRGHVTRSHDEYRGFAVGPILVYHSTILYDFVEYHLLGIRQLFRR